VAAIFDNSMRFGPSMRGSAGERLAIGVCVYGGGDGGSSPEGAAAGVSMRPVAGQLLSLIGLTGAMHSGRSLPCAIFLHQCYRPVRTV
jgi:hypothetical protein